MIAGWRSSCGMRRGCPRSFCGNRAGNPRDRTVRQDRRRCRRYRPAAWTAAEAEPRRVDLSGGGAGDARLPQRGPLAALRPHAPSAPAPLHAAATRLQQTTAGGAAADQSRSTTPSRASSTWNNTAHAAATASPSASPTLTRPPPACRDWSRVRSRKLRIRLRTRKATSQSDRRGCRRTRERPGPRVPGYATYGGSGCVSDGRADGYGRSRWESLVRGAPGGGCRRGLAAGVRRGGLHRSGWPAR